MNTFRAVSALMSCMMLTWLNVDLRNEIMSSTDCVIEFVTEFQRALRYLTLIACEI